MHVRRTAFDLRRLLDQWPYDPENNARVVRVSGGRQVLQVRTPLGLEQYELDGRPDGQRPHGAESLLDYHEARLAAAMAAGRAGGFSLTAAECEELFDEGTLFYFRYLHFFQIKDWERLVRDTDRNLRLFDFVHQHARREQDRLHLEQWRPYILRMNAVGRAMLECEAGRHDRALRLVEAALEKITALPEQHNETFQYERRRSLEALRELARQIEANRPLTEEQRLERELRAAVAAQEFERAAALRDRLRALRARSPAPQ